METVTIHKAKTNLSRLIEKVSKGEEIVIARGSKPVARLVPIEENRGDRKPGAWKGEITYTDDAFAPLADKEMEKLGFE